MEPRAVNDGNSSSDEKVLLLLCATVAQEDVPPGTSWPPPPLRAAAAPSCPQNKSSRAALESTHSPLSRHALAVPDTGTMIPATQPVAERKGRATRGSSGYTSRERHLSPGPSSALTVAAATQGNDATHSQLTKSYVPPMYPPPVASWNAQQLNEIQVLRREVFVLNEKLRVLKHETQLAQQSMEMQGREASPERSAGMSAAQLWKPVVERQRQRLEHAQRENLKLKKSVRDLKKMIKNVRRALLKRANRYAVLAETLQFPPLYPIDLDLSSDDRAMFQRMVSDIDAMHANVENARWILQKSTRKWTQPDSIPFCKGKARLDASMSIFAEIVSCEIVPFRKAQVENAMLKLREDEKMRGCRRYNAQHFGGAPQLVVTKCKFQHSSSVKAGGVYCARRATRSFVDGTQRSVALAIEYTDPVDELGKSAPGCLLRVVSWTILTERMRAGQAVETLIQSYSTVAPVLTREPCPFKWEREVVEGIVIPEFIRSSAEGSQALENVLVVLEQASQ